MSNNFSREELYVWYSVSDIQLLICCLVIQNSHQQTFVDRVECNDVKVWKPPSWADFMNYYEAQKETKCVEFSEINSCWLSYERINHCLLEVFLSSWGVHYFHRIFDCPINYFDCHIVAFIILGEKQLWFHMRYTHSSKSC